MVRRDRYRRVTIQRGGGGSVFGAGAPLLDELLLAASGDGIVMTELHGVGAFAAGEGFEAQLVFGNFGQRDKSLDGGALAGERAVSIDAGAAGREIAGNVAD